MNARQIVVPLKKIFSLRRRLKLFQSIVPRRFWFPGVLALGRIQAAIARMAGSSDCARYEASFVDTWLHELSRGGSFPIKYRVTGAEHLLKTESDEAGLLYCSVHLPLAEVMVRGFLDLGVPPDSVIAAPSNITGEGRWIPAGIAEGVKALPPGPATLLRVRTVLREGGRFAAMLDEDLGQPLKPQMMRLAGRVGARVVLCWAEMDKSGTICVNYEPAPHPIPDNEQKVLANLGVLEDRRQRIIAGLRGSRWGR